MKLRKILLVPAVMVALTFVMTTIVSAQGAAAPAKKANSSDSGTVPDRKYADNSRSPEDSYLAKFHAQDVVHKLMKKNLEQIYLLKVIVSNFKKSEWDSLYKKTYEGYKKAMELFYKRKTIYSREEFEINKKTIADFLKVISDEYNKSTQLMLDDCVDGIMALDLNAKTRSDPNKNKDLHLNQMRLRIAYAQFDEALSAAAKNNFETAIYHYRVSKTYAIRILEEIPMAGNEFTPAEKKGQEDKKKVQDKYKVDKADNLNRIFEEFK